jgi:hypothetical protein
MVLYLDLMEKVRQIANVMTKSMMVEVVAEQNSISLMDKVDMVL